MSDMPMAEKVLDFRSDTLTQPTAGMRAAMAAADVGDDVYGEDPSVNRLQEQVADLLGKEAALFMPTGTMSNQIGLRVHCAPGDEFICEAGSHIYNFEQAGFAQLSGLSVRPVEGMCGVLEVEQLAGLIRPENDMMVRTRLITLENTHNRGAGRVLPYEGVKEICAWAREHNLCTHLDGARIWNAWIASGIEPRQWAQHFDTVSVCFSKGLGAPVGSALAGPRDLIKTAKRHRRLFGGGMREAGVLAAAASYAVSHQVERLAEDHAHARMLADTIGELPGLELRPDQVDTNMVIFHVAPDLGTPAELCARLKVRGVLMLPVAPTLIRAVTHLNLSRSDVSQACEILPEVVGEMRNEEAAPPARRPQKALLDKPFDKLRIEKPATPLG